MNEYTIRYNQRYLLNYNITVRKYEISIYLFFGKLVLTRDNGV